MAGVASGGSGDLRSYDGVSSEQEGGATGEMLTEWRSSDQLESGTPSTSPPFWDSDDNDEDCGLQPSELYGKHTWKIDKFSQINKRELRSNTFEVGSYKWYILIYPQGCDVCNHLSLFLCVANHEKLLPGWSHFAQFTIAVVNKDPKKSKYSDTLHRFWKKEHDWGWKKFMELSKVMDGFVDADTLIIKAQVQVIRERADRPFRCLDCQYRRELVRVYLTNVEQIYRRFVEEKRSKLVKLMEDKARWSSFCAFWLAIDPKSRREMTRERTDTILRAVVKQFFIEKEVTSTLVMDSLYSGLRALEGQINTRKGRCKLIGTEESPTPVVFVDQDMFALIDDVLLLLERASLEPLPLKEDKGPQNRMKDGGPGDDFSKESIELDERRLTELGGRTIEIFVLAHIFSKIEGAYQEAVALKRQEELIREEAAWLEIEQKSKRVAADKEKKSKKKQGKQKRNNRKGKDKGRDDNTIANTVDKLQLESPDESKGSTAEESKAELAYEDVSDISDTVDPVLEVLHPDSEERESSPLNWDTDTSEAHISEASGGGAGPLSTVQKGVKENNSLCIVVDDSSSTCSTDSVPSVMTNGYYKANYPILNQESYGSPIRVRTVGASEARRDVVAQNGLSGSHKFESEPQGATETLRDKMKKVEPQVAKHKVLSQSQPAEPSFKDQAYAHKPHEKPTVVPSSPIKSSKESSISPMIEPKITARTAKSFIKKPLSYSPQPTLSVTNSADMAAFSRSSPQKSLSPTIPAEKASTQEVPVMSRPLSAPTVPGPRPTTSVSSIQTQPFLSRSVSSVTHHHQSYRNAMLGTNNNILTPPTSTSTCYTLTQSPNMGLNLLQPYSAPPSSIYPPMFHLQSSEFGTVNPPPMKNYPDSHDVFKQGHMRSHGSFPIELPVSTSGQPSHNLVTDEFPHLGIINDLLDDESGSGNIAIGTSSSFQTFNSGPQYLNRQFSYPGDNGMTNDLLVGPSSRFGRARSYQENGFQSTYDSSLSGSFESICDYFPPINLGPFPNGQFESLVPNQWQMADSYLAYHSTRTMDGNEYPYHIPDYSNLLGHANGYTVFRPSNGQ